MPPRLLHIKFPPPIQENEIFHTFFQVKANKNIKQV